PTAFARPPEKTRSLPCNFCLLSSSMSITVDKSDRRPDMEQPPLGEQELEVWRYIAEHPPISAREVAARFAEEQGLARTTILPVIERLRKKGYLTRRRREGVYHYSP